MFMRCDDVITFSGLMTDDISVVIIIIIIVITIIIVIITVIIIISCLSMRKLAYISPAVWTQTGREIGLTEPIRERERNPPPLHQHPEMSLVLLRRWKRVSAGSKPCSLAPNRAQLGVLAM